jgi:chitodextrinase
MQLLSFDLAANTITGTNYSPTLNQSEAGPLFTNVNFNQRFSFYAAGAPIANDEIHDVAPGDATTFDPRGNDVDSDGDVSTDAISFSSLPAGVSYDDQTGLFTYAPDAAFRGNVSFTYTLSDGVHTSNTATVTLRANNAPIATADSAITPESKNVTINVLANDSDDADAITPILASLPQHGAVLADAAGTFTYIPDPKFTGVDTFTYAVSDGKTVTAPVTVSVTVRPNAPVYNYPISETTNAGTRTGSYANLTASDNNVETIKEVISSGADVDQRWRFNVTAGTDLTLGINAWRSFSNPGTGDEYHLQYSTNGSTWSDLTVLTPSGRGSKDVTRTKFEADEPYQLYGLPSTLSGTVYIRATDVNTSGTDIPDTLTVDEIFIRSGVTFPQVNISAADGAETPANNRPVTFTVTRTGSGASIANALSVAYTLGGTATPGDDYAGPSGNVTIPAGQTSATFSITPISDGIVEGPETIIATLTPASSYDLGSSSTATGTIADLDATPPSVPQNLRVTSTTTSSIAFAWDVSTDDTGVTGYNVYRNGSTFLGTVTGTTFTDTGLSANTLYSYTVVARDAAGNVSAASNPLAASTNAAPTLPAPSNLTGTKTSRKVKLTWKDNSTTETGFNIYASQDGIHWMLLDTAAAKSGSGGTQTYTTGNLSSGVWYFKVTAFNTLGESDPSNIFNITV